MTMSTTPDLERQSGFNSRVTNHSRTFTNDEDYTQSPASSRHDPSGTQNFPIAEQSLIAGGSPTCMQPTEENHALPWSGGCIDSSKGEICSKYRGSGKPYQNEGSEAIEKACIPTTDSFNRGDPRTSEDANPAVLNDEITQAPPPIPQYPPPAFYQSEDSEPKRQWNDSRHNQGVHVKSEQFERSRVGYDLGEIMARLGNTTKQDIGRRDGREEIVTEQREQSVAYGMPFNPYAAHIPKEQRGQPAHYGMPFNPFAEHIPKEQRGQPAHYGMPFYAAHISKELSGDILEPLQVAYKDDLVYNEENALIVNLATIQRINLEILRDDLVRQAFEIKYSPPSSHTMGKSNTEKIHEYVKALRDWDYISECAKRGERLDPFLVSTQLALSRHTILRQKSNIERQGVVQRHRGIFDRDMATLRNLSPVIDGNDVDKFGGSRRAKNKIEERAGYLQRAFMAILGGTFLIGPMLVMVLHNTKATSLITTSVCVFLFGMVVSIPLEKPMDVLSATAAYAAVLVVFVGTNTSSG